MSIEPIFSLAWWGAILGGLGIFLIGINMLGESLKKIAGTKLKGLIDKFTSSPLKGIFVGILVTVLIQSSSGTTALTIGLIRAGLMTLPQAVGIIMGANIGTTVTSFLIGLNIANYTPFLLVIGVFMMVFSNHQKTKHIGEAFFSFGALFFGLTLMEAGLSPVAELPQFQNFVANLGDHPFLGVIVGAIGTAAIQSSSAFIGLLQTVYEAGANSGATLLFAIPVLFGSNIGTTITGIMAAFGGSTEAKRAATLHVIFNTLGTLVFLLLLRPYVSLISMISVALNLNPKMQIAFAHIIFNILTTAVLFFFVKHLVRFVVFIIKPKPEEKEVELEGFDLSFLDKSITNFSPQISLEIAKKQSVVMGELVEQSLQETRKYFLDKTMLDSRKLITKIEETVDKFNIKLTSFLNSLENSSLTESEIHKYGLILKAFRDIERMSDHCENLAEFFDEFHARGDEIHDGAKKDILDMLDLATNMVKNATDAYNIRNLIAAKSVLLQEEIMDALNKNARNRHVERLASGSDSGNKYISVVFVDIISNIERIGDHCTNIIESL